MSTVILTESGIIFQAVGMLILIVGVDTPREGDLGLDEKGKELSSSLPVNSPLWFLLMGSTPPRRGILERKEVLFRLVLV